MLTVKPPLLGLNLSELDLDMSARVGICLSY
jgi:hypothetical protein